MASVTAPITPAFDYMKTVLFRPFDMEKWLTIGFCAWLAHLGQGGGSGMSYTGNWGKGKGNPLPPLSELKQWILDNLEWLIFAGALLILAVLAIWVALTWLSSRGHFMFLHGVVLNRAEVKVPWMAYALPARSLFVFRLVLAATTLVLVLPLLGLTGLLVQTMVSGDGTPGGGTLFGTILLGLAALCVGFASFIVKYLTTSFVVPIMYLRGTQCLDAWREFLRVLAPSVADFVLYLLMVLVLRIAVGIGVLILVVVTCCIAGCLLGIPFVGTVLLLPVAVFFRAYSLLFLAQFGAQFNVFGPPANP